MAQSGYTPIVIYHSPDTGVAPSAANLADGELAINTADGLLYYKNTTANAVSTIGSGATGGGTDQVFVENSKVVTTTYAIPSTKNAESVGPITINSGVTVTVSSSSRWVIL